MSIDKVKYLSTGSYIGIKTRNYLITFITSPAIGIANLAALALPTLLPITCQTHHHHHKLQLQNPYPFDGTMPKMQVSYHVEVANLPNVKLFGALCRADCKACRSPQTAWAERKRKRWAWQCTACGASGSATQGYKAVLDDLDPEQRIGLMAYRVTRHRPGWKLERRIRATPGIVG